MTINCRQSFPILFMPLLIFIIGGILLLAGCSRVSQEIEIKPEAEAEAETAAVQVELVEPLFPPAIGKEIVNIRVLDASKQPINNATIKVRGDMTHAGMIPVLAEAEDGDNGLYEVLLDWSMSGDWVLTVQVSLPDGTIVEKTFPRTIANTEANCEHEDKNKR